MPAVPALRSSNPAVTWRKAAAASSMASYLPQRIPEGRKTDARDFAGAVRDARPSPCSARSFAAYDTKTRFLNHCHEAILSDGQRVIKHARLPRGKRHRNHLHTGFFLDGVFDGVCTTVAVHAFYPEYCCFHPNLHLVLQTSERAILHLRASSRIILPAGNLNRPGLGHGRRFREIASNVAVWESGPIRKFLFCKLRAHFRPE